MTLPQDTSFSSQLEAMVDGALVRDLGVGGVVVESGSGTPKDRDEVNRRVVSEVMCEFVTLK
jgi:hypothetical protein